MACILIVEDDKNILKALAIRLRARGHEPISAQDAHTAMDVASAELPDLILLDISLPGGNGFEVATWIRESDALQGVPLVFLTASRRPGLREKAARLGAAEFFEKPYDAARLLACVEELTSPAAQST